MKKIIALILALAMLGATSSVSLANEPSEVDLISEVPQEYVPETRVVEGTVKSVSEEQIEIDDLVLNIGETTLIADTDLIRTEVKEGDLITAIVSTMTTKCLPPHAYAFYVIVRKDAETFAPIYMTVDSVENGLIVSQDGNYEVSYENAEVGMYRTKNIVKAEELTKGSEIFVYADVMTMSIPALVNPSKIVIMNIAEPEEEIVEETEEIVEMETIADTRIVEGIVKSVSEEQIEIEELVLNVGETTFVADTDLIPTEVKEGDLITAVVSTMTTRSLPPQAYAFYVIVRKDAKAVVPMFMKVAAVEDGAILSQDGNFRVTYENAEVAMYRTKNIVKAEELTKGSAIFVYADMMTMSIPALVNPSKIVIMEIAEVNKAEELADKGILLGTDSGLELERTVTRAEAVALIQRTSPSAKMVYKSNFDDVAEEHWAYANISWATETGIVSGTGDNKFEPDRTVTAKELAMMLLNALNEDVDFDSAFDVATEKGLVTMEDAIEENDELTREATAKMIYNYLNK